MDQDFVRLRKQGLTYKQIASIHGVSLSTVYNIVAKLKIKKGCDFDLDKLLALVDKGLTPTQIANKLGVPLVYVEANLKILRSEGSPAQLKAAINLLKNGESAKQVSAKLNLPYRLIAKLKKDHEIPKYKPPKKDVSHIFDMWVSGYTLAQIAKKVNLSKNRIWLIVKSKSIDLEKLKNLILEGKTVSEIGVALGVGPALLRKTLRANSDLHDLYLSQVKLAINRDDSPSMILAKYGLSRAERCLFEHRDSEEETFHKNCLASKALSPYHVDASTYDVVKSYKLIRGTLSWKDRLSRLAKTYERSEAWVKARLKAYIVEYPDDNFLH